MRQFMLVMGLCSVVALPAVAQPVPQPTEEEEVLSPTEQVKRMVDGEMTYEQVSGEVRTLVDKVAAARQAEKTARLMAWLAALAAIFKLLLSAVKALGLLSLWKEKQAAVIRITTLLLGIGVYCATSIVGGMVWYEALFLGLSGPGSMVIHEYSRVFGKKKEAAA